MAGLSASGLKTQIRSYTEVSSTVLSDSVLENIILPDINVELEIIPGYPPTVNNKECAIYCKQIVNNMKDITIIFDKIDPNKNIPDGAFLGTIMLECNEE